MSTFDWYVTNQDVVGYSPHAVGQTMAHPAFGQAAWRGATAIEHPAFHAVGADAPAPVLGPLERLKVMAVEYAGVAVVGLGLGYAAWKIAGSPKMR